MTNDDREFVENLARFKEIIDENYQGTCILNPPQYQRLERVYHYFKKYVADNGGKLNMWCEKPYGKAVIEVELEYFELWRDRKVSKIDFIQPFADILDDVDTFEIDWETKKMGFTVRDVFIKTK